MTVTRPARVHIHTAALLHNLRQIKRLAPKSKVIAMVKARAYGCGLSNVVPILEDHVYAFGVACLEEALAIRALGARSDCVLFQGVFTPDELLVVDEHRFQCVIHQPYQLQWLLAKPLTHKIKVWVKVNTGMNRLGFALSDVPEVISALMSCPWVHPQLGVMTHFASADEPTQPSVQKQMSLFQSLKLPDVPIIKSLSNSAAILSLPKAHEDVVRPGIMLYGVSPFAQRTGQELGLMPVMRFVSAISAIQSCDTGARVGYGGIWTAQRPSILGVVAVGYGDGYPRHVKPNTKVWVNGTYAPIVGRISMDMLTVDLTDIPGVAVGDLVELWGPHLPVERIAWAAGTIGYELLCQFAARV